MASKRQIRRKACEGKKRMTYHESLEKARRHSLVAYQCPFGSHYHIGHKTSRKIQKGTIRKQFQKG